MSHPTNPTPAEAAASAHEAKDAKPEAAPAQGVVEAAAAGAESLVKQSRARRGTQFQGAVSEVLQGLKSEDKPTRRGARLFLFSLFGIFFVVVMSGKYFWDKRKAVQDEMSATGEAGKNLGEFIKKQSEDAKRKYSLLSIGAFTVELKPVEGSKPRPGVMNLAEIEIQLQCDEKETCEQLDARQTKVRDDVSSLLTATEREELLSREGKRRLKKKILDRLNASVPKGKIEDLFFTKLVVN